MTSRESKKARFDEEFLRKHVALAEVDGEPAEAVRSMLTLTPLVASEGAQVKLRMCAVIDEQDVFRIRATPATLQEVFRQHAQSVHSAFSATNVVRLKDAVVLEGIVSAVLMFEGGPDAGIIECSLNGRTITVDLFRPAFDYVVVRLDAVETCDLRTLWAPLEICVIGEKRAVSHGTQSVFSSIYTDYPRKREQVGNVPRLKPQGAEHEFGDNGDLIVHKGTCLFSNPQRAAIEVVCHEWAGITVLRRGPLLNAIDFYADKRRLGLVVAETCDVIVGRGTDLGAGQAPLLGAFADIFNP